MRISSWTLFQNGINGVLDRQTELAKLQQQISSGKRIQSAADDPAGAAIRLDLDRGLADIAQWNRNAERLRSRLAREENALADVGNLITRVRELALTGANATQSDDSRKMLAAELDQLHAQLMELANTRDESGRYLFGGYQDGAAPFAEQGGNVVYRGDSGQRSLRIGPGRELTDTDPGGSVFMQARSGNGDFRVATGPNAGNAIITEAELRDRTSWVPDDYTVSFDAAGNWTVTDSSAATIASGAYTAGEPIAFNGVELQFSGTPANGDSFSISPSTGDDLFGVVQQLATAFKAPASAPADKAALQNLVFTTLEELDGHSSNVLGVRASVGSRLSATEDQTGINEAAGLELKQALSNVEDLDYAQAISEMQLKLAGLEAAQQAFLKIHGMNLFDYLR